MNHRRVKHLFTAFFSLFFLSILVLFSLNSAVLLYLSNRNLAELSRELNDSKAQRISRLLEDRLFAPLFRVIFDQLIYYPNSPILSFLLYDEPGQAAKDASASIMKEVLSQEWLKGIVIYKENGQIAADMESFRSIDKPVGNVLFKGVINFIEKSQDPSGWLPFRGQASQDATEVAYYVKYPITSPSRNRGIALYIINVDFFGKEIGKIIDVGQENLMIENEFGSLLFTLGKKNVPDWIKATRPKQLDTPFPWKDRREQWQVTWWPLYDQKLSMALIARSDLLRQHLFSTQKLAFLITALFLILCGIYLLFITKRIHIPLTGIMDALTGLAFRDGGAVKLRSYLFGTERIAVENRNLIVYRFMVNMITGGIEKSDFSEVCDIVGIKDYRYPLYLLLLEPNPERSRELCWRERERRDENLLKRWSDQFPCGGDLSIRYPAGHITCFYFLPPGQELPLDYLKAFAELTQSNIAFSAPLVATLDVPETYGELMSRMDKNILHGYGNLFPPERGISDISHSESLDPLRKFLMAGHYEEFETLLFDEIRNLGEKENPPVLIRDFIVHILELIAEVSHKKGGSEPELSYLCLREESQNIQTPEKLKSWIREKTTMLRESLRSSNEENHKELFERIQAFVAQSPEKNSITQTTLAEHFSISPGFLSRLFREFSPDGFGAFLKECKLREAEKLIRRNKGIAISELARSMGYSSSAYFSRQFKMRFGEAPHDYAKKWENHTE